MGLTVIERARKYLDNVPPAISGSGGHNHTLLTARAVVRGFMLSDAAALMLLEEWNQRNEEKWSTKELEHKIRSVRSGPPPQGGDGYLLGDDSPRDEGYIPPAAAPIEKPEFSFPALEKFAGELSVDLVWLANRSALDPASVTSGDFLSALYATAQGERVWVARDDFGTEQAIFPDQPIPEAGSDGLKFMAQPVDGKEHLNPRQETRSRRSEEAVIAWRYMVIESDEAKKAEKAGDRKHAARLIRLWLAALSKMPLQIAAIYNSGGLSVHALVRVDARTKLEWDRMKREMQPVLVTLGADQRALTAIRLTRLPQCYRGQRMQKLLYLNPTPDTVPIAEKFVCRDVVCHWLDRAEAEGLTPEVRAGIEYYAPVSDFCRKALAV